MPKQKKSDIQVIGDLVVEETEVTDRHGRKKKKSEIIDILEELRLEISAVVDSAMDASGQNTIRYFNEIDGLSASDKKTRAHDAEILKKEIRSYFNEVSRNGSTLNVQKLIDIYKKWMSDCGIPSGTISDKEIRKWAEQIARSGTGKKSSYWFSTRRAATIANNESQKVGNRINHSNLVKSGKKTHTWVTFKDEKVREDHREVDEVTVPINEPFIVGGYKMMYPMDDSYGAPPEEIINCRCIEQ